MKLGCRDVNPNGQSKYRTNYFSIRLNDKICNPFLTKRIINKSQSKSFLPFKIEKVIDKTKCREKYSYSAGKEEDYFLKSLDDKQKSDRDEVGT